MPPPDFSNTRVRDFWRICRPCLPDAYQAIALDLLHILDRHGATTSVRSRYSAKGMYAMQGKVTLLDHSINVAEICLSQPGQIVRDLSALAALGHDLGKMPHVHCGHYTAAMHAHWGAEYVGSIIAGRLAGRQLHAVISAIRDHHVAGSTAVHQSLRKADSQAREGEILAVVDSSLVTQKGDGKR